MEWLKKKVQLQDNENVPTFWKLGEYWANIQLNLIPVPLIDGSEYIMKKVFQCILMTAHYTWDN